MRRIMLYLVDILHPWQTCISHNLFLDLFLECENVTHVYSHFYNWLKLVITSHFHSLQTEVRKREEKEAAEALRRDQELREAKRLQQRLNFLIQQTELYSHFIQNKSDLLSSEALPMVEEKSNVANEEVIIHLYYMLQQYFPIGD